jgi:hypothetical protein
VPLTLSHGISKAKKERDSFFYFERRLKMKVLKRRKNRGLMIRKYLDWLLFLRVYVDMRNKGELKPVSEWKGF